jgi:hypothetical protein
MAEKGQMMGVLARQRHEVLASLRLWLATVAIFFVGFHVFQFALLVWRFEVLPNYVTVHDWPGGIARIARMTPSVADMIPIMLDEWFIEIGSMNYAFGRGIAEWSFVLMPAKAFVVLVIAMLLATNLVLLHGARSTCALSTRLGASAAVTGGVLISGAATTTITWVVCCAAPTWVVGFAVMGMSVNTALALQPIGGWLSSLGLFVLATMAIVLAWQLSGRSMRDTGPSSILMSTPIVGMRS